MKNIAFVAFFKCGGLEYEERIYISVPEDASEKDIYSACKQAAKDWALEQVSLRIKID